MYTEAQQYHHHYQMLAVTGLLLNSFAYKGQVIEHKATGYYVQGRVYGTLSAAQQAIDDDIHKQ